MSSYVLFFVATSGRRGDGGEGRRVHGVKTLSSSDPDGAGFVRWRVAFYVAGSTNEALINLLMLLDGYFVWINEGREERVTARKVFFVPSFNPLVYPRPPNLRL